MFLFGFLSTLNNVTAKKIHFTVPVWGASYISDYLTYSLPCQLARGNLPALVKNNNTLHYHIITDTAGKQQILVHPSFNLLKSYANVSFHALEQLYESTYHKRNEWLRYPDANWLKYAIKMKALEVGAAAAAKDSGAFVPLMSDIIFSDTSLSFAIEQYQSGASLVLVGGPRIKTAPFVNAVNQFFQDYRLSIKGEELQDIIVKHIHPFSLKQDVNSQFFNPLWPDYVYWYQQNKVLIQQGVYCFPLVIDMSKEVDFYPGYTIDTMPLPFDEKQISVITDTKKCCVASIDDASYDMGDEGRFSAESVAVFMLKHAQFHHRIFSRHQIRYQAKQHNGDSVIAEQARKMGQLIAEQLERFQSDHQCLKNEQLNVLLRTKSNKWRETCFKRCLEVMATGKNIVLMGAGAEAEILMLSNKLHHNVVYVLDNDPKWENQKFHGVDVYSPNKLSEISLVKEINVIILTSERHVNSMKKQINQFLNEHADIGKSEALLIEVYNPYE